MEAKRLVSILNDLIETCKDGEYGFGQCAEHTSSDEIRTLFTRRAMDCRVAAQELQVLVRAYGGTPDDHGTAAGALRRGWVAVLGNLAGSSDRRMLEQAERGEDAAVASYRKALREVEIPPDVRALVERQMDGVMRNHDQVRQLRERAKATA